MDRCVTGLLMWNARATVQKGLNVVKTPIATNALMDSAILTGPAPTLATVTAPPMRTVQTLTECATSQRHTVQTAVHIATMESVQEVVQTLVLTATTAPALIQPVVLLTCVDVPTVKSVPCTMECAT